MRRKKHTNSCLLHLLGLIAGSGFILLCVAFGLYFLTEKPSIYEKDNRVVSAPISLDTGNNIEINKEAQAHSHIADREDESMEASMPLTEDKTEDKIEEKSQEESVEGVTKVPQEEIVVSSQSDTSSESAAKQPTDTQEESLEFEEVTVYDSYILQLDENLVGQIGDTLENGQIDYGAVIGEMFSSLSFAEQVKLLNMILSKVQNINVNEIWNMISDGISKEDSVKLQQLVQENFTIEELDELYGYYASMDIADNNE